MPARSRRACPDVALLQRLAKVTNLSQIAKQFSEGEHTVRRWCNELQIVVPDSDFLPYRHWTPLKDWCRGCRCDLPWIETDDRVLRYCKRRGCQDKKRLVEMQRLINEITFEARRHG